jgi:hypothetical protein
MAIKARISRRFDCPNCGLVVVSFVAEDTPRCPQCHTLNLGRDEPYENVAELLANLTHNPVVSELVYETLDALIGLCRRGLK